MPKIYNHARDLHVPDLVLMLLFCEPLNSPISRMNHNSYLSRHSRIAHAFVYVQVNCIKYCRTEFVFEYVIAKPLALNCTYLYWKYKKKTLDITCKKKHSWPTHQAHSLALLKTQSINLRLPTVSQHFPFMHTFFFFIVDCSYFSCSFSQKVAAAVNERCAGKQQTAAFSLVLVQNMLFKWEYCSSRNTFCKRVVSRKQQSKSNKLKQYCDDYFMKIVLECV